jgi:beta-lactam-binding protein with PASTA domain
MAQNKSDESKKSSVKRLWANDYIRNIIYAVLIFAAIIFASKWFLSCITRHGENAPVPDFKGLHIEDAKQLAAEHNLRIEISDSLFISSALPGTILEQHPAAEIHVKKNRMIYLTINCITPKKIEVPNVVGHSLRQAKAVLGSKGIHVGKITYRDDMAMNNVIGQVSKDVETGSYISNDDYKKATVYFGDEIELVLGLGENPGEQINVVPNVSGKDIISAKSFLIESYLNVGNITYDSTVKTPEDKRTAVVKTQYPSANTRCSLGANVDITLTVKK